MLALRGSDGVARECLWLLADPCGDTVANFRRSLGYFVIPTFEKIRGGFYILGDKCSFACGSSTPDALAKSAPLSVGGG